MEGHGAAPRGVRPLSEIPTLDQLPESDFAAFDRVCDAFALEIDHGDLVLSISGKRVSDVRGASKVHIRDGSKVSRAVKRLLRGAS